MISSGSIAAAIFVAVLFQTADALNCRCGVEGNTTWLPPSGCSNETWTCETEGDRGWCARMTNASGTGDVRFFCTTSLKMPIELPRNGCGQYLHTESCTCNQEMCNANITEDTVFPTTEQLTTVSELSESGGSSEELGEVLAVASSGSAQVPSEVASDKPSADEDEAASDESTDVPEPESEEQESSGATTAKDDGDKSGQSGTTEGQSESASAEPSEGSDSAEATTGPPSGSTREGLSESASAEPSEGSDSDEATTGAPAEATSGSTQGSEATTEASDDQGTTADSAQETTQAQGTSAEPATTAEVAAEASTGAASGSTTA